MKKYIVLSVVVLIITLFGNTRPGLARDYMMIVGSTTMYPFSKPVMENFLKKTGFKNPLVQPTGSGGGLMLFCAGVDQLDPDVVGTSRRMRKSEFAMKHLTTWLK